MPEEWDFDTNTYIWKTRITFNVRKRILRSRRRRALKKAGSYVVKGPRGIHGPYWYNPRRRIAAPDHLAAMGAA